MDLFIKLSFVSWEKNKLIFKLQALSLTRKIIVNAIFAYTLLSRLFHMSSEYIDNNFTIICRLNAIHLSSD